MLELHLRKDIEFIPHPALDLFTEKGSDYQLKDSNKLLLGEEALNSALDEAKGLELDYRCVFNVPFGEWDIKAKIVQKV